MAYDTHVWPDTWLFQAILDQAGGSMLDESGTKIAFDNAIGRRQMSNLRRFVTDGKMALLDFEAPLFTGLRSAVASISAVRLAPATSSDAPVNAPPIEEAEVSQRTSKGLSVSVPPELARDFIDSLAPTRSAHAGWRAFLQRELEVGPAERRPDIEFTLKMYL